MPWPPRSWRRPAARWWCLKPAVITIRQSSPAASRRCFSGSSGIVACGAPTTARSWCTRAREWAALRCTTCASPWDTPDAILESWASECGIGDLSPADLAPSLERVKATLGVRPIQEEQINTPNQLVRRSSQALGWHGDVQSHNRGPCPDCSAGCVLGCPNSGPGTGKQSMAVTYVPRALEAGARLYTHALAEAIRSEAGRVTGVEARIMSADGRPAYRLTVRCKAVVLSSGAINSPQLWLNSRLPDPGHQVGQNLHLHPAVFVAGIFDEAIEPYQGIPHSYYIDQFLDLEGSGTGYILMPIFGPPVLVAASLPSFGQEHWELMRRYRRMAAMLVLLPRPVIGPGDCRPAGLPGDSIPPLSCRPGPVGRGYGPLRPATVRRRRQASHRALHAPGGDSTSG